MCCHVLQLILRDSNSKQLNPYVIYYTGVNRARWLCKFSFKTETISYKSKKRKKKTTTQNKHFFNTDIKKKKIVRNEE